MPSIPQTLLRWYIGLPDHPAKFRIERWLAAAILPDSGGIFTVNPAVRLHLHTRDWIEYTLLKEGQYEPLTLRFIERNLSNGDTAAFAGVNFGLHLIVASRAVGSTGRVIGFEPQPGSAARALSNFKLNEWTDNIKIVLGALGSSSSMVAMAEPPSGNSGAASLLDEAGEKPFVVHIDPAPAVLSDLDCGTPRLMLLDVQGFEGEILRGLRPGTRIPILIVEVEHRVLERHGSSPELVFQELDGLGYDCYDLSGATASPTREATERNVIAVLRGSPRPTWVEDK